MKKKKIKLNKKNKRWLIISGIVILIVVLIIVIPKLGNTGIGSEGGGQVKITPLSQEQINIVGQAVLSSDFIEDLPKNGAIALQFYDFKDGQRVWQSGFLIGQKGFLASGTPDLVLIMHAKYISYLDGTNLCEVVQAAQVNNDMWVESQESNAKLFLKYAGMMKHRDCFGF